MLVLGITEGESIEVSGPCRIEIVRPATHVRGTTRIGFEAPQSTTILRHTVDDADELRVERIRMQQMEQAAAE